MMVKRGRKRKGETRMKARFRIKYEEWKGEKKKEMIERRTGLKRNTAGKRRG